jgi:hypothetical protein
MENIKMIKQTIFAAALMVAGAAFATETAPEATEASCVAAIEVAEKDAAKADAVTAAKAALEKKDFAACVAALAAEVK